MCSKTSSFKLRLYYENNIVPILKNGLINGSLSILTLSNHN